MTTGRMVMKRSIGYKATSYAVRKIISEKQNGFSDMGPKIRFLCDQKKPFSDMTFSDNIF